MNEFINILETATKKPTAENLRCLAMVAKALVEVDPDKYKRRGSYPSTWDTVHSVITDLESGSYLPVGIVVTMEGLALWYFGTRGDFLRHPRPGVWEWEDVKILHEHGRWAVLVRRSTKRGSGVRWEETVVPNATEAFKLARASRE